MVILYGSHYQIPMEMYDLVIMLMASHSVHEALENSDILVILNMVANGWRYAVVIFYGFEIFVGFIQAFVFSMLASVFVKIAISHHDEESHAEKHEKSHKKVRQVA